MAALPECPREMRGKGRIGNVILAVVGTRIVRALRAAPGFTPAAGIRGRRFARRAANGRRRSPGVSGGKVAARLKALEVLLRRQTECGEAGPTPEAAAETLNTRLRVSALNPERQEPSYARDGRYAVAGDQPVLLRMKLIESRPEWEPPKKRNQPRAIEAPARHLELPHTRYVHRVNPVNCRDLETV